jgi:hypothetical protein
MDAVKRSYKLLTNIPYICKIYIGYDNQDYTDEEFILEQNRYIEASDVVLKEMELLVNGDIDLNKEKHKIHSFLKTFEDIEYNLIWLSTSSELIADMCERQLSCTKLTKEAIILCEETKNF